MKNQENYKVSELSIAKSLNQITNIDDLKLLLKEFNLTLEDVKALIPLLSKPITDLIECLKLSIENETAEFIEQEITDREIVNVYKAMFCNPSTSPDERNKIINSLDQHLERREDRIDKKEERKGKRNDRIFFVIIGVL